MPHSEHFSAEFHALSEVIRRRRTTKDFDGKPVPIETIESILELAVWVPNHGMTEPWRFRIMTQESLQNWTRHLKERLTESEVTGFTKTFEKLEKVPVLIYLTHQTHDNPLVNQENYAATCAAVQNILLAATAQHLQSYWSTSRAMTHPLTLEYLDINDEERFVGALWLGHGEIPTPKPRKRAKERTLWIK